jgi:hypothetical protein
MSFPGGLFFGGTAPTWSNTTLRRVLRQHGSRARAWPGSTSTPAWARAAWASASTAGRRRCRRRAARACVVGGGGATPVTSIYDGSSTSAFLTGLMWTSGLRGMPAGRIHRHCHGIRHGAVLDVMQALRAEHWLHLHPEAPAALAAQIRSRCWTPSIPTPTPGRARSSARPASRCSRRPTAWRLKEAESVFQPAKALPPLSSRIAPSGGSGSAWGPPICPAALGNFQQAVEDQAVDQLELHRHAGRHLPAGAAGHDAGGLAPQCAAHAGPCAPPHRQWHRCRRWSARRWCWWGIRAPRRWARATRRCRTPARAA